MPVFLLCHGRYDEQSSLTEKTCTSPGWVAAPGHDLPDAILLPKPLRLLDVLDLDPFLAGDALGASANRLPEGLRELGRVVE
jgi:hypothetical protein